MNKIVIVSKSEALGGAARAAFRLKQALTYYGLDANMQVQRKGTDDWSVIGPKGKIQQGLAMLRPIVGDLLMRLQKTSNVVLHSPNILPSRFRGRNFEMPHTITNLHWVGGESMSVEEIGSIGGAVAWTMHDMWAFCGAEHYVDDTVDARYRVGYMPYNRTLGSGGLDIDRWVWKRKRKCWKRPITMISPSRWLASCAQESMLMREWPIHVVPNPLDVSLYRPYPKANCRDILQLPSDTPLILFGALDGTRDHRKGFDLLCDSLKHLRDDQTMRKANCVVVGQGMPRHPPDLGFNVHWMGHVNDDWAMALMYSAADVVVVPSRSENLPQFCTEAQACGTPVVAFNCSGLPDTVEHFRTGYLATPYCTEDLAEGIRWILSDSKRHSQLSIAARERAERLWNYKTVAKQYCDIFGQLC